MTPSVNGCPVNTSAMLLQIGDFVVSFVIVAILFATIFKVLPDADVAWHNVWVGALITAVMFVAGKYAISLYLGSRNMGTTYGAAGSLILIMMWIYYSALIFLFGAEITQAWARHFGAGIRPSKGAIRVVQRQQKIQRDGVHPV